MKSSLLSFFLLYIFLISCQTEPYNQGKNLYTFYCENCHMTDGSGLASLIPSLTDVDYLKDNRAKLPCIIKYGLEGPIEVNGKNYNEKMEGFIHLTDAEISNIANYVLYKWSANEAPMLPEDVSESLSKCIESSK